MSDNTTPEPERLLLNADFSTIRNSEWEPDDGSAEHERQRREKLSRERLLLLADMTPSASDVTINQLFTDPGPVSVKDDPEQAAAWIDKMQKEAAEYWRGDEPARPAGSEEQTG